jgi:hypothetical protein
MRIILYDIYPYFLLCAVSKKIYIVFGPSCRIRGYTGTIHIRIKFILWVRNRPPIPHSHNTEFWQDESSSFGGETLR